MSVIGQDFEIVDEPVSPDAASLTGRPHLLSTHGGATPVVTSRANTGNATTDAHLEVLLAGGASEVVVQGYGASLPTLSAAVALLPAGPGTVIAPEAVASADHIAIEGAWLGGKVALLNPPSGANDSAITTLKTADVTGGDGRGSGLFADWITYGLGVGSVDAPLTVGLAAAIARNDVQSGQNTGLAAAGTRGVIIGAQAIVGGPRPLASRDTLANAQVNTAIVLGGQIRNYGFRSLANLTTLPIWAQLAGARVVMDYRARASALSEESMFDEIDGQGLALGKIKTLREGELILMWKNGSLYGKTASEAFAVDVGPAINPLTELQAGRVRVRTRLKVSSTVEHILDQTVRVPLTAAV